MTLMTVRRYSFIKDILKVEIEILPHCGSQRNRTPAEPNFLGRWNVGIEKPNSFGVKTKPVPLDEDVFYAGTHARYTSF